MAHSQNTMYFVILALWSWSPTGMVTSLHRQWAANPYLHLKFKRKSPLCWCTNSIYINLGSTSWKFRSLISSEHLVCYFGSNRLGNTLFVLSKPASKNPGSSVVLDMTIPIPTSFTSKPRYFALYNFRIYWKLFVDLWSRLNFTYNDQYKRRLLFCFVVKLPPLNIHQPFVLFGYRHRISTARFIYESIILPMWNSTELRNMANGGHTILGFLWNKK